jgi:succinate dehydrogenase/fumarate reductase cytochrome b subunit
MGNEFLVFVSTTQMNFYFSGVNSYVSVLHRLLLVFAFDFFYFEFDVLLSDFLRIRILESRIELFVKFGCYS